MAEQNEDQLFPFNEDETFYKAYFKASRSPETQQRFLDRVDKADAIRRHLVIPELLPEIISFDMKDTEYFKENDSRHVFIVRHNRYTPAFLHQHDFFEIIFVYSGFCEQSIEMEKRRFEAGDLIFIAPHVHHTMEVFDDHSIIFNILLRRKTFYQVFRPMMSGTSALAAFFSRGLYHAKPIRYIIFHLGNDALTRSKDFMRQLYREQQIGDEYSDPAMIGMLTARIALIMRNDQDKMEYAGQQQEQKLTDFQILGYIQQNLQTVTLKDAADHFGFSEAYCSRLVRNTTGYTFSAWKRMLRVRVAERLLINTDLPVGEIGAQLGYENTETFIRSFRKEQHMTPSRYRKAHRAGPETDAGS